MLMQFTRHCGSLHGLRRHPGDRCQGQVVTGLDHVPDANMNVPSPLAERLPRRGMAGALARAVAAAAIAACSSGVTDTDQPRQPLSSLTAPASPSGTSPSAPADKNTTTSEDSQKGSVDIQIRINDQRFAATLTDSAAARDLLAQLPVTLDMSDHGGVEKTGPLPSSLSLEGQPDGADPDIGDVGCYAPGNDLVLYYGDQSYYRGIVVLGRLKGEAAARIAELDGAVTAVIEPCSN